MEYHWGIPVIIMGLFVSLMWAWRKINQLEYKVNAIEKEFEKVKYIDDEE